MPGPAQERPRAQRLTDIEPQTAKVSRSPYQSLFLSPLILIDFIRRERKGYSTKFTDSKTNRRSAKSFFLFIFHTPTEVLGRL